MSSLHTFFFGVYPYIALAVFFLGSLLRFDREQYTWRTQSSQILSDRTLTMANHMFHVGILGLFGGHLVGLLTPKEVYTAFGLTVHVKHNLAMIAGGIFGTLCFVGLAMLIKRRLTNARVKAVSKPMDYVVQALIMATLALGLVSIYVSAQHPDGSVMVALGRWAQSVVTLQANPAVMADVPWVYKLHMVIGMTIFLVFPFTRLVHVWSGFASVDYLLRPYQLVRTRR
jgi:nitrate reductase gamma subunit